MPLLSEFLTTGRISRFGFWMRHMVALLAALLRTAPAARDVVVEHVYDF